MLIVGGRAMGAPTVDVTVDPIVVSRDGQSATGPAGILVEGTRPPATIKDWWPWLLLLAGGLFVWWISSEDEEEEDTEGPKG